MRVFRIIIFLFSISYISNCYSQNAMSVGSFELNEMDITAIQEGTIVTDQNDEKCALIKIITTLKGLSFDVGSLGVRKTIEKNGEVWVYVPNGIRKISIYHQQVGQLRDYQIPIAIKSGRTYIMQLIAGNVRTIIDTDDGKSYFSLSVTPPNAIVNLDGVLQTLEEDGSLILRLNRGLHTFDIQAAGYAKYSEQFELGVERFSREVTLTSTKGTLTVKCETSNAEIFVNDVFKSKNSWTGALNAGDYLIEIRKEGYYTEKKSITLKEQGVLDILIPELTAKTGNINVKYKPVNADVYLDGNKIGKSPDLFKSIIEGKHTLKITKEGYVLEEKNIIVEEGKTLEIEGSLTKRLDIANSITTSLDRDAFSYAAGMSNTEGLLLYLEQQYNVNSELLPKFCGNLKVLCSIESQKNSKGKKSAISLNDSSDANTLSAASAVFSTNKKLITNINDEIKDFSVSLDVHSFYEGFIAGIEKDYSRMTFSQAENLFKGTMNNYKKEKEEKLSKPGKDWLKENSRKDDVITLPSGLQYKVIIKGSGPKPVETDRVAVKYEGHLIDGTEFDSSYKRTDPISKFKLNQVIKGWTEALSLMPVGSKWEIYVPHELAYGSRKTGQIPPYSTLIFTIELIEIN